MRARDIMASNPSCVTPETALSDAARLMKEQNVGMLPVVEREGSNRLVGVVTDRDIAIRHVAEGHTGSCPVREAMSGNVATLREDSSVDDVMKLMGSEQVRRIPIVDERGGLVGVVSQADIVLEGSSDRKAERTVEQISKPTEKHAQ